MDEWNEFSLIRPRKTCTVDRVKWQMALLGIFYDTIQLFTTIVERPFDTIVRTMKIQKTDINKKENRSAKNSAHRPIDQHEVRYKEGFFADLPKTR